MLRPFPGTKELLTRMNRPGLRLGVASPEKEDDLKNLLRVCGADDLIEAVSSSVDANRSKPGPDIVHAALRKIGLLASEVVLLGDTSYDVVAGRRADVAVIGVRCGGWGDADLLGAIAMHDGPAGLFGRYDVSLLARTEAW